MGNLEMPWRPTTPIAAPGRGGRRQNGRPEKQEAQGQDKMRGMPRRRVDGSLHMFAGPRRRHNCALTVAYT